MLVILVVAFTFLRPYLFHKENKEKDVIDASRQQFDQNKRMSGETLMGKINGKEPIEIIDVRDQESFQLEHILNATNIPFSEIRANAGSFDKSRSYVLVDQLEDPVLVSLVQDISAEKGFSNIYYLAGGFSGWRNQHFPTVSGGDPFSFSDQSKVSYIKTDELKKAIDARENIYIIDLRKEPAFAEGHIRDSVNIYLGDIETRHKEVPIGKKIVLVDNDGLWAFKGAVKLFDAGVFNVFALSDGLDSWKAKGFEIVK